MVEIIIDISFLHRWLLLDFKREFPFEEALRIFEVLNSQYLELNSDRALVVTEKVIAKEFEMDGECSLNLSVYCTYMYN